MKNSNCQKKRLVMACSQCDDKTMDAFEKWKVIIEPLSKTKINNLFTIVSFIFNITNSNCFLKEYFYQIILKWTDAQQKHTKFK